ncbi:MAG: UDP-N-acetylmuramate--L-alanine ligase [Rudaea sp.]
MMDAKHVHMVGIGGIGLSAIARILLARGVTVSGSDQSSTPITEALAAQGARIYPSHRAENIGTDTDLVVITSAVGAENPEVREAETRGIRVIKRREFLAELTAGCRTVAVAGSHGKTTTTALIGLMLERGGLDPSVVVGGVVPEWEANARPGRGEYFVIEADEYDNAFLGLTPFIAVITNVDYDHPDIFPTRGAYVRAFGEFAGRATTDGAVVVCKEDEGAQQAAAQARSRVIQYGLQEGLDWHAVGIRPNDSGGTDFSAIRNGEALGAVSLRIPGRHNVLNALAALAAADFAGVSFDACRQVLDRYAGAGRRFEVRGEFDGVTVVDDYAHHPSEIRATLAAARERFPGREVWAVFQPHTYTRTRALLDEFAEAFSQADKVIVTEIYASREHDTLGLSGRDIVARMNHPAALFIPTLDEVVAYIDQHVKSGTVVLTLGAGDVNRAGERLADLRNVQGFRT